MFLLKSTAAFHKLKGQDRGILPNLRIGISPLPPQECCSLCCLKAHHDSPLTCWPSWPVHQHPAGGVPPEEVTDEGDDHEESLGRGREGQPGQPLDERRHQVRWQVAGDKGQEGAAC